jgi:hypothetical protein
MKELGRVKLHLGNFLNGYLEVNGQLKPLPTGFFLDKENGNFYWQPGLAFSGEYRFQFMGRDNYGNISRKSVTITILPGF